jgi:transcriptional regulator with PAS, ATPase and Fis domain
MTVSSKIIFVSPDEKLTERARDVIDASGEMIDVYQGSLSDGVIIARQAVENGAKVIISRGGTGNLIKKNLQVPVVKVEISGYDIIHAVTRAMENSTIVGVVGFDNLVSSAKSISTIMDKHFSINILTAAVKNEREVEKRMEQLYAQGVRGFVGGITVVSTATHRFKCPGVLLESGQEAITEAIREARHVLEVQTEEQEKAEMMKSIIDFAYDGIIGIDTQGIITVFNPIAEKILRIRSEDAIGKLVDDVIPETRMNHVLRTGQAEKEQFQKIGEVTIATNRIPIVG